MPGVQLPFDVIAWLHRDFELLRAELKGVGDHVAVPPELGIVQDIVNSDPRPSDLRTAPPVDDPRCKHVPALDSFLGAMR